VKVLLVSHTAEMGGAERCLLDLAQALGEREVAAVAVCPAEGPLTEALAALRIPVLVSPMRRPGRGILRLLELGAAWPWSVWRLRRAMRTQRATVVYNNTVDALYAPFAAAWPRIPCVWHVHEARPEWHWARRFLGGLIARFATRAVFNSRATLEAFAGAGARPSSWSVVYNGVAIPAACDRARAEQHPIVVGFAGDLRPHKRPDLFLRAVARARARVGDLRAIIAGDGVLMEPLRAQARSMGLGDVVTFRGRFEKMADFYCEIDILAHTAAREGFGLVVVEAMAAGVPVVATRVGGLPEVVEHEVSGLLVAPDDEEAIAGRIIELASDAELRQRMGAAGRDRVAGHFTRARYRDELIEKLREAASSSRTESRP
jgi:glycosyltransferase involved in cell wall biosynthesis